MTCKNKTIIMVCNLENGRFHFDCVIITKYVGMSWETYRQTVGSMRSRLAKRSTLILKFNFELIKIKIKMEF